MLATSSNTSNDCLEKTSIDSIARVLVDRFGVAVAENQGFGGNDHAGCRSNPNDCRWREVSVQNRSTLGHFFLGSQPDIQL